MSLPLIIDRLPFILIERGKIFVHDNSLVVSKNEKIQHLPVRNLHLIILGNGVSITSEAMILCAKNNCYIAASKGGSNIYSTHHGGIYKNPIKLINQVKKSQDPAIRLGMSKYLFKKKVEILPAEEQEKCLKLLKNANSVEQILGIEGYATKLIYKHFMGDSFLRKDNNTINTNINIANSILYNFIASIITCLGYSPNIGFLHGHTRRGALVFDICDIFRYKIYFSELLNIENKNIGRVIFDKLSSQRNLLVREIIEEIEKVCSL